ncbi:MAG: DNA polymerase III subunit beta, partial [Clostridia bacterium]|nr:DNA polymerase III subunit beta [Clostridia bacterium]
IEFSFQADVKEEGQVVINAKMFMNIIKNLSSDIVSIEVGDKFLTTIKSGNAKFEIMGLNPSEFPELPIINHDYSISISKNMLRDMINRTVFSVYKKDDRPVLRGCLMEIDKKEIKMVALDGYRLAYRKYDIDEECEKKKFIIPEKALLELSKLLKDEDEKILINSTAKHAVFIDDNYKLVTRLIEGEYMNYEALIKRDFPYNIECPVSELMSSVYRASLIVINDITKCPVKIHIGGDNINVSCETSLGFVDDNISVSTGDEDIVMGFNSSFILEALRACDEDKVILKLKGSKEPLIIAPTDNEDFIYLVLPVKI